MPPLGLRGKACAVVSVSSVVNRFLRALHDEETDSPRRHRDHRGFAARTSVWLQLCRAEMTPLAPAALERWRPAG